MRHLFYNHNAMADAQANMRPAGQRTGDYHAVIHVNGKPVMGCGHTRLEAAIHTIQAAQAKYHHNAHIFDLIGRRPEAFA